MHNCRDCRAPITGAQRSGYCQACLRRYCQTCKVPLPFGRQGRRCRDCNRAAWEVDLARHSTCRDCGAPLPRERRSLRCHDCWRERHRLDAMARLGRTLRCRDCRAELPKGRQQPRCTACEREYRRRLFARKRWACRNCGINRPQPGHHYCAGCHTQYERWRRAYDAGDPVARSLRTKRPYRRWQERSP